MYAKNYPWTEEGQVLEFDAEDFNTSILSWRRACLLAASLAKCSYQRALHLAPWQANTYADIAMSTNLICSLNESFKHDVNAWYDIIHSSTV